MNHNQISEICREELLKILKLESEKEIPSLPWDDLVFNFAATFEIGSESESTIREIFSEVVEVVTSKVAPKMPSRYSKAMKRHCDHYIDLTIDGKLIDADKYQLKLALERIKKGLIKPG